MKPYNNYSLSIKISNRLHFLPKWGQSLGQKLLFLSNIILITEKKGYHFAQNIYASPYLASSSFRTDIEWYTSYRKLMRVRTFHSWENTDIYAFKKYAWVWYSSMYLFNTVEAMGCVNELRNVIHYSRLTISKWYLLQNRHLISMLTIESIGNTLQHDSSWYIGYITFLYLYLGTRVEKICPKDETVAMYTNKFKFYKYENKEKYMAFYKRLEKTGISILLHTDKESQTSIGREPTLELLT